MFRYSGDVRWRRVHPLVGEIGDDTNGAIVATGPCGADLAMLFSDGEGWEHVSVSVADRLKSGRPRRLPNWDEMCYARSLFWEPNDTVLQFHPAQDEHVDRFPVLHLWRQAGLNHVLPPGECV